MWGKISQYHQDIEKWDLSPCVPRAGADCIPNTHHCSAGRHWWQFQKMSRNSDYWHHFLSQSLTGHTLVNAPAISHLPSVLFLSENLQKILSTFIGKKQTNKKLQGIFFFLLFSIDAFWQGRKGGEWLCLYEIIISVVSSLQWPGHTEPAQLLLSM